MGTQAARVGQVAGPLAARAMQLAWPVVRAAAHRAHTSANAEVVQPGFSAWQTLDQRLKDVRATLNDFGVSFLDVTSYSRGGGPSLATRSDDRARLLRGVVPALRARGWQARVGNDVVSLWRDVVGPAGDVLLGANHAIRVETWHHPGAQRTDCPPDCFVSPPWRRATYLRAEAFQQAGITRHVPQSRLGGGAAFDVQFPIDAVYTWVDGTDAAWRASYQATNSGESMSARRFVPHDELRYALRSLEYYASWVHQVVIVVGQEPPDWLNLDHPKLRVVRHEEFMDAAVLPTFNSHAIESQMHNIDGLADHFIYLNDDFFFGRPVRPEQFFHSNGLMRFFPSPVTPLDPNLPNQYDSTATAARKQARDLMANDMGFVATNRLKHAPYPMRLDVLAEMEQRWPKQFAATAASRLRAATDYPVEAFWAQWYAYATGRAVPANIGYMIVPVDKTRARAQYAALMARTEDVFCLNESPWPASASPSDYAAMGAFLRAYFPVPSSFERGGA